jgi:hypothetical protein
MPSSDPQPAPVQLTGIGKIWCTGWYARWCRFFLANHGPLTHSQLDDRALKAYDRQHAAINAGPPRGLPLRRWLQRRLRTARR